MKTQLESKFIMAVIIFVLLFVAAVPVQAETLALPLHPAGGSPIFPVIGLISSWFRRNRTYKNAEAFITDRNQNYKNKLKTLDQQLAKGTIYTGNDNSPEAQQAAYVKVKALLEQERDQGLAFAESIKKGARKDFNKAVKDQVLNIVLSTGFVQNVLGSVVKGFGDAQKIVDGALNEINGSGDIASQITGLRNIAGQLQFVGGLIGGPTGEDINSTVQGILDKVNSGQKLATDELTSIKSDLQDVQTRVQRLKAQGYVPDSSEVINAAALQLVGLGPGTPTTEAILNLLGLRTGTSKEAIRERGMQLLLAGENVRCRKILTDLLANLKELETDTAEDDSSQPSGDVCNPIQGAELLSAVATKTSLAGNTDQGGQEGDLPADQCDASQFVAAVPQPVQWTLPDISDKKCYQPLVFTLKGNTSEEITVYVHEIAAGTDTHDKWIQFGIDTQSDAANSDLENWWSSDQTTEVPEFIAVFSTYPKYNGCEWIGSDPAASGVHIVTIPSNCP